MVSFLAIGPCFFESCISDTHPSQTAKPSAGRVEHFWNSTKTARLFRPFSGAAVLYRYGNGGLPAPPHPHDRSTTEDFGPFLRHWRVASTDLHQRQPGGERWRAAGKLRRPGSARQGQQGSSRISKDHQDKQISSSDFRLRKITTVNNDSNTM